MTQRLWLVDGVHLGKHMSELPITYLLWFVGSPIMRRTRWIQCQAALIEIRKRLTNGLEAVEADLIADLRPRSIEERLAMKQRRNAFHRVGDRFR